MYGNMNLQPRIRVNIIFLKTSLLAPFYYLETIATSLYTNGQNNDIAGDGHGIHDSILSDRLPVV